MSVLDSFQSSWRFTKHCEEPTDSPPGLHSSLGIRGHRVRARVWDTETLTSEPGLEQPCAQVDAPNAETRSRGGGENSVMKQTEFVPLASQRDPCLW